jgi:hypothetical protein
MAPRELTQEETDDVLDLAALQWPATRIARELGLPRGRVERAIRDAPLVRLAGLAEVGELIGKSRQRTFWWSARPGFPEPIADLRGAGRVWDRDEVVRWAAAAGHRLRRKAHEQVNAGGVTAGAA